jgi:hypothetical protein
MWLVGGALDPSGSGSYYVAAWHSTDAGAHWSLIFPAGETGAGLNPSRLTVARSTRGPERILVYNAGGAYESDDGGTTWTTMRKPTSANGEYPPAAMFFAAGAIFEFAVADACPEAGRLYRYRKPSGAPSAVPLPTRWGAVHSWGGDDYFVTELAVGANGRTAIAIARTCDDKESTGIGAPQFLAYRPAAKP